MGGFWRIALPARKGGAQAHEPRLAYEDVRRQYGAVAARARVHRPNRLQQLQRHQQHEVGTENLRVETQQGSQRGCLGCRGPRPVRYAVPRPGCAALLRLAPPAALPARPRPRPGLAPQDVPRGGAPHQARELRGQQPLPPAPARAGLPPAPAPAPRPRPRPRP